MWAARQHHAAKSHPAARTISGVVMQPVPASVRQQQWVGCVAVVANGAVWAQPNEWRRINLASLRFVSDDAVLGDVHIRFVRERREEDLPPTDISYDDHDQDNVGESEH